MPPSVVILGRNVSGKTHGRFVVSAGGAPKFIYSIPPKLRHVVITAVLVLLVPSLSGDIVDPRPTESGICPWSFVRIVGSTSL